eukprot:757673-Hanusia_phi.AAC.1
MAGPLKQPGLLGSHRARAAPGCSPGRAADTVESPEATASDDPGQSRIGWHPIRDPMIRRSGTPSPGRSVPRRPR